ncbi:hypothetical protein PO909_006910 [Leuciscus waleckii]
MGLRRFSDALRDLDDLCCVRPNWTEVRAIFADCTESTLWFGIIPTAVYWHTLPFKGFFRKGNVLLEMGRQTEALIQFYHCLKQQPDFAPAKNQIKKVGLSERFQKFDEQFTFLERILEAEGMPVPEEVPRILHVVSEYLQDPCPITSSVSPSCTDSQRYTHNSAEGQSDAGQNATKVKHGTSGECCLSLCQAVSFLPTAEDDEEMMMKREEKQNGGVCSVGRESCLSVLTVTDFECPLCIRLFYEPVTTPCGHTFCKNCIERSLDHNLRCPLCKQPLQEYFKNRKYNPTVLLQEIICRLFPQQLAERKQVHEAEMEELSNLTKDIPIFVCTVAYPGIPCPLHIFEPRYRLMMRRCMETGTKKFGMCSYEHGKGFADYGCMLDILELELLPDGRSYVDTVGGSRFRVLRRGQRDGYQTADIEYLEDHKVEGGELELLQLLHDSVYQQAREWYHRLNSRIQEQISRQYGIMPEKEDNIQASANGPAWCWWLLSVLQLDPAYQTTVLSLTSLKDRLGHLRIVLEYFSQS